MASHLTTKTLRIPSLKNRRTGDIMEYGLSLGSNTGDRAVWLDQAARRIGGLPDVRVLALSSLYETEPVGVRPEYRDCAFLNAVLIVETAAAPPILAGHCHAIEAALGRVRVVDRYAPRAIDIDLIYAGATEIKTDDLILPHPRWAERRFVVQPLAEVRPELVLPGQHETVAAILTRLPPRPAAARWGDVPSSA